VVEEDHADGPAVVEVDDPGARVDELLEREARAGRDAGVGAPGDGDGQVGGDEALAAGGDDGVLGRGEVVA